MNLNMRTITSRYKEGLRACDFAPLHCMLIKEYQSDHALLQLIIYNPSRVQDENMFAWAIYLIENGSYVFKDLEMVVFDETVDIKDQRLPNPENLAIVFYKKFTDGSLYN